MRPLIGLGFLAALSCLACGGANHSVTAPSPISPTPPPGPAMATLAVSTFTAAVRPPSMSSFGYAVTLRLSETGGMSGATLTKLVLSALPGGGADLGCGPPLVRIDRGGTWDMASLGYCAREPTTSSPASSLVASVEFADDDGRVGSFEATAIVIKP